MRETYGFLQYIDDDHVDFLSLCDQVEEIVRVNWHGVNVYLKPIYKYYYCLFQKMIMPIIEKIYTEPVLPDLSVRIYLCMCEFACVYYYCIPWHTHNAFGRCVASRLEMNLIIYFDLIIRNDA